METESTSTPAGEAATAELSKILSDPSHPDHAGYLRNDEGVHAKVREMYAKAHGTSPAPVDGGLRVTTGAVDPEPGETPEQAEARVRNDVILAPLKTEWGPDFDQRFSTVRAAAQALFTGELEPALDELGTRIRLAYGTKGETAALKFLAELEAIKQGG